MFLEMIFLALRATSKTVNMTKYEEKRIENSPTLLLEQFPHPTTRTFIYVFKNLYIVDSIS